MKIADNIVKRLFDECGFLDNRDSSFADRSIEQTPDTESQMADIIEEEIEKLIGPNEMEKKFADELEQD